MSDTFDAWHDEIENFATRGERLRELGWTEALRAAWLSSRRQALEEAAAICDRLTTALDHGGNEYRREASASACASAIRREAEGK